MIQKNNTSPYRSLTGPAGLITVLSFDLDLHAATTTAQSNKYLGRYEVLVDIRRVYTVYWSGKDEKWAGSIGRVRTKNGLAPASWQRCSLARVGHFGGVLRLRSTAWDRPRTASRTRAGLTRPDYGGCHPCVIIYTTTFANTRA